MTLKEFANIDSFYRDVDTGREISHEEYMHRVIGKLGLHNIKPYIPFSLEHLKEKLKDDIHLNNTPIQRWDEAGGFWFSKGNLYPTNSGLVILFRSNKITCFSPSDCVCVLKEAARMLVKEVHDAEKGNH